jgi:hypothetical protein
MLSRHSRLKGLVAHGRGRMNERRIGGIVCRRVRPWLSVCTTRCSCSFRRRLSSGQIWCKRSGIDCQAGDASSAGSGPPESSVCTCVHGSVAASASRSNFHGARTTAAADRDRPDPAAAGSRWDMGVVHGTIVPQCSRSIFFPRKGRDGGSRDLVSTWLNG